MGVNFLKKFKIKKKFFKKNTFLLKNIKIKNNFCIFTNFFRTLKKIENSFLTLKNNNHNKENIVCCLSQKLYNTKGTIYIKKNLNTFSIGSIIRYFKIKQGKYIRRNLKGTKIFLNFFKNLILKKYYLNKFNNYIVRVNGFDYNLYFYKNFFKNFYKGVSKGGLYFIFNIKIPFTKTKDKKVKAIKKRLKKKIFLNFVKNVK
jgi:hypothetical protein